MIKKIGMLWLADLALYNKTVLEMLKDIYSHSITFVGRTRYFILTNIVPDVCGGHFFVSILQMRHLRSHFSAMRVVVSCDRFM